MSVLAQKRHHALCIEESLAKRLKHDAVISKKRPLGEDTEFHPKRPRRSPPPTKTLAALCAEQCAQRSQQFELASSVMDLTAQRNSQQTRLNDTYRRRVLGGTVSILKKQDEQILRMNGELLELRTKVERLNAANNMLLKTLGRVHSK